MPPDILAFALSSFVTLLVTIGPIEAAAVYAGLTAGVHLDERGQLAWRTVAIAGILIIAFGLAGNPLLAWMHVSLPAFRFAAGVMLFLQAINLTFGGKAGLSSISPAEHREALAERYSGFSFGVSDHRWAGRARRDRFADGPRPTDPWRNRPCGFVYLCLALTYAALLGAERLKRLLGVTGADVVGRVSGILLGALAAQFIFDGLREARLF